jgi:hypothetical protein
MQLLRGVGLVYLPNGPNWLIYQNARGAFWFVSHMAYVEDY